MVNDGFRYGGWDVGAARHGLWTMTTIDHVWGSVGFKMVDKGLSIKGALITVNII